MKRLIILFVAVLALFATSCTPKDTTNFSGTTYEANYKESGSGGSTYEIYSQIMFTSDKDFKMTLEGKNNGAVVSNDEFKGTYVVSGKNLTITDTDGTKEVFTISGNTLISSSIGKDVVFKKK